MAGLQRSVSTFRRSGSSGLVWEDRFANSTNLTADATASKNSNQQPPVEFRPSRSVGSAGMMMQRSTSNGGRRRHFASRTAGEVSSAIDPPSPKLSACGFWGFFAGGTLKKRSAKSLAGRR